MNTLKKIFRTCFVFLFKSKSSQTRRASQSVKKSNAMKLKREFIIKGPIENNLFSLKPSTIQMGVNSVTFGPKATNNLIECGENCKFNGLKIVIKGKNNRLEIGNDVVWRGSILIAGNGRKITIGNGATAQGVYLLSGEKDIYIGSECMFSREIEIRTTDAHKIYEIGAKKRLNPPGDVHIGNKVWVAARVIISKGAKIADGSVVGAASFVNKVFEEPNTVLAGAPAKIVKRNIYWER